MITGLIAALIVYVNCPADMLQAGSYQPDQNIITICRNFEENNRVLYHESSHWIYFNKLTEDERVKRKKLYSKPPYVTDYAGTMPEEDRAEEGRVYLQKIKTKNTIKKSFVKKMMRKYGF